MITDWQYMRGEICYTYVHPNSYRQAYRFLPKWQRLWSNYERRHPIDEFGTPVDPNEPPMTSLDALMDSGWDVADLRDPLEGIKLSVTEDKIIRAKEQKLERLITTIMGPRR
jgi:hypothetical protein